MRAFTEIDDLVALAERHIVTAQGCAVVWHHWPALAPASGRLPIVLVHGGSGSWLHWMRIIAPLMVDRSVWCVDIPGLGDSELPVGPHTPEAAAAIVAETMQMLLGAQRLHLVGFSFGSHVAAYMAARESDRLASFILSGSAALGLEHPNFLFAKERLGAPDADVRAVHRRNLEILMFADPRNIDDLAIEIQARNVRRARFKSRIFATTRDIPMLLPKVTCPVGAIWGAADNILTASHTPLDRVYDILRAAQPDLVVTTLSDAGHWAAYEAADAYVQALRAQVTFFEA